MKKSNKKFILSEQHIRIILDHHIISRYKDIRYSIYKAKNTNSYYVTLDFETSYVTARISDHKTFTDIRGLVVNKYTSEQQIINLFIRRIAALKRKNLSYLFKKMQKRRVKSCMTNIR